MTSTKSPLQDSATLTPSNYDYLCTLVYRNCGIVLDSTKEYLLQARLLPIARSQTLRDLNALCDALRAAPASPLQREIINAMTTNETFWFRDPVLWSTLRATLLPALCDRRRQSRSLRFWSAAASTGQEAYSLAITLRELPLTDWTLEIIGTDISTKVIEQARDGLYHPVEINRGLPAPMLVKYFQRQGLHWQIADSLRAMTRFHQFDLRNSMTLAGPFDLIFCRNILIYFDLETKRRILDNLSRALAPGGYLLLGATENLLGVDSCFRSKTVEGIIAYQSSP